MNSALRFQPMSLKSDTALRRRIALRLVTGLIFAALASVLPPAQVYASEPPLTAAHSVVSTAPGRTPGEKGEVLPMEILLARLERTPLRPVPKDPDIMRSSLPAAKREP